MKNVRNKAADLMSNHLYNAAILANGHVTHLRELLQHGVQNLECPRR
jgi:hypothetical protein